MLHVGHYMVRPNPRLERRAQELRPLETDWLLDPTVISKEEPDRSAWKPSDHWTQTKLAFLIHLADEYAAADEFKALFPEFVVSEEQFDLYWVLDSVDHIAFEQLTQSRWPAEGLTIRRTGNGLVDGWLDALEKARAAAAARPSREPKK